MWLWRQLRQNKSVDLVKVAKALGKLGIPARAYLEEVVDALPAYDPIWVLQHFCARHGESDPFLASLKKRFRRLLDAPLALFTGAVRRLREIDELEEKCWLDRQGGKAELEILGRDLLGSAEAAIAGDRGLSRAHLADCARLLLVWGAVQRRAGSLADGVAALVLAHRLGVAAKDPVISGLFFHDGAQILSRLGHHGYALRFAQNAARQFQTLRDRGFLPMALVQLGSIYDQLGQHREARLHAIASLRLAGRHQWQIRTAAWTQLATLAKARGDRRRAFALLERAKKNSRGEELTAYIHGRQAVLLVDLSRAKQAARAFSQAMRYFERQGQYREIAVFAADLAEALLRQGRVAVTLELVRATTPHFERLDDDLRAAAPWMDLCALILDGHREKCRDQIAQVRAALARAEESAYSGLSWVTAGLLL